MSHPQVEPARRHAGASARVALVALTTGLLALAPSACDTGSTGSLAREYLPRSAHQAYGHSLAQARLSQTELGRAWRDAAERALHEPSEVDLPFELEGSFEAWAPGALGFAFDVGEARRLRVALTMHEAGGADVFADLYAQVDGRLVHVASAAPRALAESGPLSRTLEFEVYDAARYVLRIQPELLVRGDYRIRIGVEPVLAFPVGGYDSRAIQSGFGADRDGGRRAHRGVDIFAERGTPALAAVDAWVVRVGTTPRGGNVVWLQPLYGGMRLYYAHLDTQLVDRGQFVAAGDVVGTVGNTGNAITTPPHLHFGVYMRRDGRRGGAHDPYRFLH